MTYITVENLRKTYTVGDQEIVAVDHISFQINEGEFVVIVGPSGAGKTTVMNMLGGMDKPTSGTVVVADASLSEKNDKMMTQYRRESVGFVFQSYNLIPNLTALENVEMATQIRKGEALDPQAMLEHVGLGHRLNNFPTQLSGGEQQRVAIARALAKKPNILLCDEPTGALDTETGKQILKVLKNTAEQHHTTVIVITHNPMITLMADRVIEIKNGTIERNELNDDVKDVDEIPW